MKEGSYKKKKRLTWNAIMQKLYSTLWRAWNFLYRLSSYPSLRRGVHNDIINKLVPEMGKLLRYSVATTESLFLGQYVSMG